MEPEEPILSPELMEALGNDPQALILSKKKKDKEKKPQIAQEIVENVKKVSKKSAKRMAQIQKRKIRESKQSEYLELIKSNELSSEQRQLMTSSKTLNHTMSLKETLSLLIKKEKAGIQLTDEERSLLYTQKESISIENEDIEDLFGKYMRDTNTEETLEETENYSFKKKKNNSKDPAPESSTTNKEVIEEKADELLFSLSDIMPTFTSATSSNQNINGNNDKKKKKKKKNQSINENEAISDAMEVQEQILPEPPKEIPGEKSKRKLSEDIPVPETQISKDLEHEQSPPTKKKSKKSEGVSTIGKSLLSQFLKFKAKVDSQEKPTLSALMNEIETSIPEGNDIEQLTKEDHNIPHNPFIAEEMNLPFNSLGYVQLSEEEKQKAILIQQQIVKRKVFMINRPREVEMDRINLPVCQMEQEIVEAVNNNDVILLCGETGSGKSTQVPQFLYEVGYSERGMIGIAQPRRVAVTSTADRVNYEMGQSDRSKDGRLVGYQIRYDSSTVGIKTKLKYMTDGILLREVTSDILLRQYSVVILDEAHERNVNTDLLLGMISRTLIVRKRIAKQEQALWAKLSPEEQAGYQPPLQPLKLIIMSATIRVKDFQADHLFPHQIPPVIHVQARQYPVTTHFAKKTELKNYLQETHKKICQIHRKLPAGGILVFLTGKREILYMCSKLKKSLGADDRFPNEDDGETDPFANKEEIDEQEKYERLNDDQAEINSDDDVSLEGSFSDDENEDNSDDSDFEIEPPKINTEEKVELEIKKDEETSIPKSADDIRSRMLAEALGVPANDSPAEIEVEKTEMETEKPQDEDEKEEEEPVNLKPLILPLYAMMSPEQQAKVFAAVPEGYRLIVVATNVAETSITIPGVTYVVDSGRCKEKVISSGSSSSGANITKYEVRWITKASSNQRQGRAGRTGPGHCYRLYSANFYHEHMKEYLPPEITQTPLEDVVLQMASIGIKDIESFPFPTMPPVTALNHAINLLSNIGAVLSAPKPVSNILTVSLTEKKPQSEARLLGNLTDIGKMMAKFPVHPRFSKMLVIAVQQIQNSVDKCSLAQTNKKPDFTQIHQSIKLLSYVLTLVATLAERTAFLRNEYDANKANEEDGENNEDDEEGDDDSTNKPDINKGLFYHSFGDSMARLVAAGAYFYTLQMLQTKEEAKLRKDQDVDEDDPSAYKPKVSMQTLFKHDSLYSFCLSNQLHSMTLQRVYDLRHQLQSIVISLLPSLLQLSSEEEYLSSLFTKEALSSSLLSPASPPSQSEEIILRQIVLCGYCDNIARKLPLGMIKEGNRRKRLTAYQSCNPAVSEALYIHPNSNLFPSDPTATLPEYIVYSSLLRNHRGDTLYMANLSVINANWIPLIAKDCPLLHWGKPLTSPTPFYDQKLEKMMCYVIPTFGTHSWQLPVVKKAIEEIVLPEIDQQKNALMIGENQTTSQGLVALGYRQCDEVYRWFGRYLLEGQIGLKTKNVLIKTNFNDNIQFITQNKIHPKISSFLRELVKYDIRNKLQLFKLLKSNDKFLSEEIQNLLKIEFRKDFRQVWAKLLDYN